MRREPFVIYSANPKLGDTAVRLLESTTRLRMEEPPRNMGQVRLKPSSESTNKNTAIAAVLTVLLGLGIWFVISHLGGH
jgi:hypothetical protein